jgi:Membrane bound FAD containing D-sorbitol dehydrogenase
MTDITRRALLSGMTATAATAALGSILALPPLALADTPESPEQTFSKLSASLTGIDQKILGPGVDPLGLNHEIFAKVNEKNSATLQTMLEKFRAAGTDEERTAAVASMMAKPAAGDDQTEKTRFLGRSIILAWYLGAWYEPEDLKRRFYEPALKDQTHYSSYRRYSKSVLIPHIVLSPNAYTASLVWRAMQAHPMGYSNLQFGYWAQNPPGINSFIKAIEAPK